MSIYTFKQYIPVEMGDKKCYFHHGYIYDAEVLENALNTLKCNSALTYGQLHSDDPDMTINPSMISHELIKIDNKEDGIYITIKILKTIQGKILKEMIDALGIDKFKLFAHMTASKNQNGIIDDISQIFRFDIGLKS